MTDSTYKYVALVERFGGNAERLGESLDTIRRRKSRGVRPYPLTPDLRPANPYVDGRILRIVDDVCTGMGDAPYEVLIWSDPQHMVAAYPRPHRALAINDAYAKILTDREFGANIAHDMRHFGQAELPEIFDRRREIYAEIQTLRKAPKEIQQAGGRRLEAESQFLRRRMALLEKDADRHAVAMCGADAFCSGLLKMFRHGYGLLGVDTAAMSDDDIIDFHDKMRAEAMKRPALTVLHFDLPARERIMDARRQQEEMDLRRRGKTGLGR